MQHLLDTKRLSQAANSERTDVLIIKNHGPTHRVRTDILNYKSCITVDTCEILSTERKSP